MTGQQTFLLQRVQPAMVGLIDGSLSTLAPIFSVAIVTHKPHFAFIAGVAAAFGAGVSMAFSEGLSDTGELTGRGPSPRPRHDHRRGHVHRRHPAHAAVLDPPLPSGPLHGDRGRRLRALDPRAGCAGGSSRSASSALWPGDARRCDHRLRQRWLGSGRLTSSVRSCGTGHLDLVAGAKGPQLRAPPTARRRRGPASG